MYDLIIKNGHVIDPSQSLDTRADLYVKDGVIAAPEHGLENAEGLKEIDADGCFVVPGLIDSHMHVFQNVSEFGTKADLICIPSGVTTAIDAGSAGLYNFESFYKGPVMHSTVTIKSLIHPSHTGVQGVPHEEVQNPLYCTPEHLRLFFHEHGDVVVGIKIRVHSHVTAGFGLRALEAAAKTALGLRSEGFRCNLVIHLGDLDQAFSLADVLSFLSPGDVVTHMYRQGETTILGADGAVMPEVWAAQRRGILFDTGCSRPYISLGVLKAALEQGFYPDTISSDLTRRTCYWRPAFSMDHKMTLYLNAGLPFEDIVRATTITPATVFGLTEEAGTLQAKRPADVAILKVIDKEHVIEDLYGGFMRADRMVVPMATVKAGVVAFQQIFL